MRSISSLAAVAAVLVMTGCGDLDVENLNGASVEGLLQSPTKTAIIASAQNLMAVWRLTSDGQAGTLSKYGFEHWQIRASGPVALQGVVLEPQTGGFWSYTGVKNVSVLLAALDPVGGFTDAEKEGIRGWAKTILAVQLEDNAQAHDTFGIVLDVPADPLTEIPPIALKPEVWPRIFQLLDEADAHLANAGSAFAFRLGPGYAGFDTPATFRLVNRALKARYQVLYDDWNGALASLAASFLDATPAGVTRAGLQRGPFHTYTSNTGDGTPPGNGLSSTDRYANTRIRDEAQLKAVGGALDDRVGLRVRTVPVFAIQGVTTDLKHNDFYNISPTVPVPITITSPLPIIRNEELILLRAEANLGLGNASAAIADINLIRVNSGGLPPIPDPYVADVTIGQPAALLDELLYEKRYSLWGEIGTVWLDMRHYGKILQIPRYDPTFKLFDIFPIPQAECEVRGFNTKGCFQGGYRGI